jgi:hypothetical protein
MTHNGHFESANLTELVIAKKISVYALADIGNSKLCR